MLNTNCYDRVNSSIYVLTRGKCICKSMFFQEKKFHSSRNIPCAITNSLHMRSCVRKKKMYWCVVLIFNLCFCLLKGRRV